MGRSVGIPDRGPGRSVTGVGRRVSLGELLVGVEGAALLRTVVDGDDTFVAARLEAIRRLVEDGAEGGSLSPSAPVPELDVETGYAAWAPIYDQMSNALIPGVHDVRADQDQGAGHPVHREAGPGAKGRILSGTRHR